MISGNQIRAARALLNWPVNKLAELSGVSSATITRIETDRVANPNKSTLKLIKLVFEANGIEFIADNEREGVALRRTENKNV
jgi:transcriptional regulator with XRE-family HTH domain